MQSFSKYNSVKGKSDDKTNLYIFNCIVISEGKYICQECGQRFRMKSWLAKHLTSKHIGNYSCFSNILRHVRDTDRQVDWCLLFEFLFELFE